MKFCQTHKVKPKLWLGKGPAWVYFVSLYTKSAVTGNTIDRGEVRAQTVREYLEAVNDLFELRGHPPPTNFALKGHPPALFYENVKTWESKPNR